MDPFEAFVNAVGIILAVAVFYLVWKVYCLHKGGLLAPPHIWIMAAGIVFAIHEILFALGDTWNVALALLQHASGIGHAVALMLMAGGVWSALRM